MTPNTIFEYVKNDFLLSNPKLVFFTEFNLTIGHLRVTIGHLRVTIGHLRVIMGHLRLTIGYL